MKAEQRHELKTNALARGIDRFPALAQQYGNKVLTGLIVVLLAIILIRVRTNSEDQRKAAARANLAIAESRVSDLRNSPLLWESANQETVAGLREQFVADAEAAIKDALTDADDNDTKAFATLARGNLNLALAEFPVLPGATTRKAELATHRTIDEYLTAAEKAYSSVLSGPAPTNHEAISNARIGLAAVAEDRSNWDEASKRYQEVLDDAQASKAVKAYVQTRQTKLADLRKPVLLAAATTGPVLPELPEQLPSGPLGPALPGGTVAPATVPAGPSTLIPGPLVPPGSGTPASPATPVTPSTPAPATPSPTPATLPATAPSTQP